MTIHSFEDLLTIDEELATLFLRPDEAVSWIYAVENGIKEWIGEHNKQYWEIVRYVSEQRGILGMLKKDRKTVWLKREDFARVLLKFCPNAFETGETVSALKSSMEHYQFAAIWKELDKKPDGHIVRPLIKAVEDLLDNIPIIESDGEEKKPTLEDLLAEYLQREIDEQNTHRFPCSKVRIRPQYQEISPAISVETYKSEKFLKEHRPSHIEAYEFIDGVLQKSKLNELTGQYQGKQIKLYIVSSFGLLPDVRAMAMNRGIGYVLLNPNSKMTSEKYVLPRSIEDYSKRQHDFDVLAGIKPLTAPMLIMDGSMLTSSLTDVLSELGVTVKSNRLLHIPYLPDDEIENRANALTKEVVEDRIQKLHSFTDQYVDSFPINPFIYASSCGLGYDNEVMEGAFQLGRLDIENNCVILNSMCQDNINRYRFTMAHELGHYILHSSLFKEQGVVSIGESEDTLSIRKCDYRKLEYQANKFASCLLMPQKLVQLLYAFYFERCIHQKYGDSFHALYYNPNQPETWPSYNCIVGNMAILLGVSLQAMGIRLKALGLLNSPD